MKLGLGQREDHDSFQEQHSRQLSSVRVEMIDCPFELLAHGPLLLLEDPGRGLLDCRILLGLECAIV